MKKIPIGVENFKEIITNNCYYVDKTKFIEKILNDGSKIKLFTRPRRLGRSKIIFKNINLKIIFRIQISSW